MKSKNTFKYLHISAVIGFIFLLSLPLQAIAQASDEEIAQEGIVRMIALKFSKSLESGILVKDKNGEFIKTTDYKVKYIGFSFPTPTAKARRVIAWIASLMRDDDAYELACSFEYEYDTMLIEEGSSDPKVRYRIFPVNVCHLINVNADLGRIEVQIPDFHYLGEFPPLPAFIENPPVFLPVIIEW